MQIEQAKTCALYEQTTRYGAAGRPPGLALFDTVSSTRSIKLSRCRYRDGCLSLKRSRWKSAILKKC